MENKANNSKIEDEKTLIDSISDEKTIVDAVEPDANGEPLKQKRTISKKTALLAGGGVLLAGGAAAFAMHNQTQTATTGDTATNSYSWDPHTAPQASPGTVNDNMSFAEAFAAARHETGAGGVFTWHGQTYSSFYEGETNAAHQPIVETQTVEHHDNVQTQDVSVHTGQAYLTNDNLSTSNYAGNSIGIDSNNDGKIDTVFLDLDKNGSADAMLVDLNQDGKITEDEIQIIHDPSGLQSMGTADGSVMTVDLNLDGKDDVVIADANFDHIGESYAAVEVNVNNEHEQTNTNTGTSIVYTGEVSGDVPNDVSDSQLDHHAGDLAAMNDNFDEQSWNA